MKSTHRNTAVNSDYITLSLGVSAFVPDVMSTPQALVDNADRAPYETKNNGRNMVVRYEQHFLTTPAEPLWTNTI